jgi:hypothetical protein
MKLRLAGSVVVMDRRAVVRTRSFNANPEDVIDLLRGERFTGRVTIDMSQGGACSVQAEDRSQLPFIAANNNSY